MLSTVALLLSAVGGWLAGMLADRFGRSRILQITILWFAFFTFLSGFTHSFSQLLVTRGLQGLGFGGEWAVGAVLMGEAIRAEHRGKAVGTVQAGWAIGWGIAAICYFALFSLLPASIAWRVMFWIGIMPSLLVFYIQRHVPEPEVFQRTRALEINQGLSARFLDIFSPALLRVTMLAALLAVGAQGGYYAITTWLPTYLRQRHGFEAASLGLFAGLPLIVSMPGDLLGGVATDRLVSRYGLRVGRCSLGSVSYLIAGVALLAAARASTPVLAAILIALATGATMFTLGAAWATVIEVGRNQVGVVGATMNSAGNLAAMLNPLIVAYSVEWFDSWNVPLYVMGILFLVGAASWTVVDPSRPVFDQETPS
jgi:MFS family permease